MSDEEQVDFNKRIDEFERRFNRVLKLVASMAGGVAITALACLAAWQQIVAANGHLHEVKKEVVQIQGLASRVDAHVQNNDQRLDAVGAPPPSIVVQPSSVDEERP